MLKTRILVLSALSTALLAGVVATSSDALAQPPPGQPPAQPPPAQPPPAQPDKKPDQGGSGALAVPENPPAPPAAGAAKDNGTPPALPKTFADEAALALRDSATGEPVAGWHNMFFFRDPDG